MWTTFWRSFYVRGTWRIWSKPPRNLEPARILLWSQVLRLATRCEGDKTKDSARIVWDQDHCGLPAEPVCAQWHLLQNLCAKSLLTREWVWNTSKHQGPSSQRLSRAIRKIQQCVWNDFKIYETTQQNEWGHQTSKNYQELIYYESQPTG